MGEVLYGKSAQGREHSGTEVTRLAGAPVPLTSGGNSAVSWSTPNQVGVDPFMVTATPNGVMGTADGHDVTRESQAEVMPRGSNPVSYTHLTLPTIE